MVSIISQFVLYVARPHNYIGEFLANQTVGNLTFFKGQCVFVDLACHDPSHGWFYMAEGAFCIRIGLPPCVVPGNYLALSLYGLIDRYLCLLRAHVWCPMSGDLGVVSVHFTSLLIMCVGVCFHDTLYPMTGCVLYLDGLMIRPGSADALQGSLRFHYW